MIFKLCQCIAQTSLAHWAQPNILYLQVTHITCTTHIVSLYKALYCTLLFTHQYTDYLVFLSHFTLLTWYQSHFSDFLVPVDISGILPLSSPSSSSHCQKRVTAVTPTVPATLRSHHSAHQTTKAKAQSDRTANPEQNPTKNGQKPPHTCHTCAHTHCLKFLPLEHALHGPPRAVSISHTPHAQEPQSTRASTCLPRIAFRHISPRVTSHCHVSTHQHPKPLIVTVDRVLDR